jgi:hypothetical protein
MNLQWTGQLAMSPVVGSSGVLDDLCKMWPQAQLHAANTEPRTSARCCIILVFIGTCPIDYLDSRILPYYFPLSMQDVRFQYS